MRLEEIMEQLVRQHGQLHRERSRRRWWNSWPCNTARHIE
jgi:hypothetical protein